MRSGIRILLVAPAVFAAGSAPGATAVAQPDPPALTSTPPAWTQSGAATFTFTGSGAIESFECRLDGGDFLRCEPDFTPPEGSQAYTGLAEGAHQFQVRTVDAGAIVSAPVTFSWTVDWTPPVLAQPDDVVAEATSPDGAEVAYDVTATDALDPAPAVTCLPEPGALFPLGSSQVECSAADAAGNESGPVEFDVLVEDTTAPALTPYPDLVVQQTTPTGALVAYDPWPTAEDAVDGTLTATCVPESPPDAPLFFTLADSPVPVECGAEDSAGNVRAPEVLFHVIVNAGPAPPQPSITTHPPKFSKTATAAFAFVAGGNVATTCRLDGPTASAPEPCTAVKQYADLADGAYVFTVESRDLAIETVSQATWTWTVDTVAPPPIGAFAGRGGDGLVTLSWRRPTDPGYANVRISRARSGGAWRHLATLASATRYTDRSATNGVVYRYRIESYDKAGNGSPPAYTTERASRVFAPQYGAVVTRPPLVDWASVKGARYYNVQVWRDGRKVLSRWPGESRLRLTASWRDGRRVERLRPGRYTVFVWPGFGPKAAARYGALLGTTSFAVRG